MLPVETGASGVVDVVVCVVVCFVVLGGWRKRKVSHKIFLKSSICTAQKGYGNSEASEPCIVYNYFSQGD